jgi:hypothetical protein
MFGLVILASLSKATMVMFGFVILASFWSTFWKMNVKLLWKTDRYQQTYCTISEIWNVNDTAVPLLWDLIRSGLPNVLIIKQNVLLENMVSAVKNCCGNK